MQEAIPYRTYIPLTSFRSIFSPPVTSSSPSPARDQHQADDVRLRNHVSKLVDQNALIVFGRRGCCMCHVVMRLLQGLGVNPPVFEVDEDKEECVILELSRIVKLEDSVNGGEIQFPCVFVGGKLFGGLDKVMSTHISGELVPVLKDAGALWL